MMKWKLQHSGDSECNIQVTGKICELHSAGAKEYKLPRDEPTNWDMENILSSPHARLEWNR